MTEDKLLESVSDTVHWLWADWMKHQYSKLEYTIGTGYEVWGQTHPPIFLRRENAENRTLPKYEYGRWKRQMLQSYYDLSEKEKESDRVLAKQIIQNWTYNPFTGEKL